MKSKILVLDDDEDIVSIVTYILEESGYETQALYSGEHMFETIEHFKPDLVLMDIMLGNMDGRLLCRELKARSDIPPVILISASHDVRQSLLQAGAPDDFIAKPFDIDFLLARVEHFCAA